MPQIKLFNCTDIMLKITENEGDDSNVLCVWSMFVCNFGKCGYSHIRIHVIKPLNTDRYALWQLLKQLRGHYR